MQPERRLIWSWAALAVAALLAGCGGGSSPLFQGNRDGGGGKSEACASTQQCIDKLGGDACKVDIACDPATSICTWQILDKDGDGHPPEVCGGDDCDDSDPARFPGNPEICDGKDNDCNGLVDDGSNLCPGLAVCTQGACVCPPADTCGSDCVDKQTDKTNCGSCNHVCSSGSSCQRGVCVCSANATTCDGQCIDTTSDPANCGGCNQTCPTGDICQNSKCVCGGGLTSCGRQCVDTQTDSANCGGCDHPCGGVCQNGSCIHCTEADLYLLVDTTGSMSSDASGGTGTPSRLDFTQNGINDFMAQPGSKGLGLGIGFFPVSEPSKPCTTDADCGGSPGSCSMNTCPLDSCLAADYSTPAIPIVLLPNVAPTISSVLTSQVASGGTTPEPLEGALGYAKTYEQDNPTHRTAVVMIADGLPNECTTTFDAPDSLTPAAKSYATGSPPIPTYVIGIGSDETPDKWNTVAAAGNTGTAQIAMSQADVATALATIRSKVKSCQ